MRITKKWCRTHRGKTEAQRRKCHSLFFGTSKVPKRKFKRRKW